MKSSILNLFYSRDPQRQTNYGIRIILVAHSILVNIKDDLFVTRVFVQLVLMYTYIYIYIYTHIYIYIYIKLFFKILIIFNKNIVYIIFS